MNKAESERLGNLFQQMGNQPTAVTDEADLIVLNSCVVRQSAEERVINKLTALESLKKSHPTIKLAVTGCFVDTDSSRLKKRFPYVDYFFKPGESPQWLGKTESVILAEKPQVSTFIPIIQGCNNYCSYCVVPYRRGREKSRPLVEILSEVRELVKAGVKQVVLLGQNVDSYGNDLPEKLDLSNLLNELNDMDGLKRIRFLTNHPKDMSDRLICAIAQLDKVCEQINLPIQSGNDDILKAMRRDYTVEQYRWLVEKIRKSVPQISISTDVIVGFPSEREEQFIETRELLRELRFDNVHIAAYSLRPGTVAANKYEDDIPPSIKKERLIAIEHLQAGIASEINARLLGHKVEVLVEGRKKGKWYGRSRSGKLVFFTSLENLLGQLAKVIIIKTSSWSLQGEIINDKF
jgi:tRNA-2-methylthio-N6-dimethylallyladenosine synthase